MFVVGKFLNQKKLSRYAMLARMKKHPIKKIKMQHAGIFYQFPVSVAKKYQISTNNITADELFADINEMYTKPAVLLRGIRYREGLTQKEMAKKLDVKQSDISKMENGKRKIGRVIAKRIENLFDVNYKSFLE